MSQRLFDFPDTSWVKNGRILFEAHMPPSEIYDATIDVCISITHMMKSLTDAMQNRECRMGAFMVQEDVSHRLQHNPLWKVFGSEIIARYHNGLRRHSEMAEMMAKGYKPTGTEQDAAFIEGRYSWLDALNFIYEVSGGNEPAEFRKDVRIALYGS